MRDRQRILIVGGFARAGKSTLVNQLKEEGWGVASTSDVLGDIAEAFISAFGFTKTSDFDLKNKVGTVSINNVDIDPRTLKIKVAEEIIAPILTREAMIRTSLRNVSAHANIVCESIGGEELKILLNVLEDQYPHATIAMLNMRSHIEETGIDIRQLLEEARGYPVYSYLNTFQSFDDLKDLINNKFFKTPF